MRSSSVDHAGRFVMADPGHRLVQQQQPRRARERHRQLELPLLAMGELACNGIGAAGEPHGPSRACASRSSCRSRAASRRKHEAVAAPRPQRDLHVLGDA